MKSTALETFFKKYYNEAMLYVYSLCHNRALAEDIVSDSFLKAFNTIDEERDGFKFWLLKVCRNRYFDCLRKDKKLSRMEEDIEDDNGALVDTVIRNDEYRALYHAISLLKENYREVVRLYYFDGLSVSEIADITEQSVQNVKVQMYRARTKLKEILEAKNEF